MNTVKKLMYISHPEIFLPYLKITNVKKTKRSMNNNHKAVYTSPKYESLKTAALEIILSGSPYFWLAVLLINKI